MCLQCRGPQFNFQWTGNIHWRRDRLPTPVLLGFPHGSAEKETACNEGDLGLIPGLGRFPGEGKVYPLQYSGLENSMDCIIHGVTKSQTWLTDFHFFFHFPQPRRWRLGWRPWGRSEIEIPGNSEGQDWPSNPGPDLDFVGLKLLPLGDHFKKK